MWRKVRTALSLPPGDWWTLAQAWILLLAVDLGLRWMPFQRMLKWLHREGRTAQLKKSNDEVAQISRLGRLVKMAGRNHLYPMTCLRQALALKWLLDRDQIETDLRIGVKREQDQFNAHAWIEYRHQPVGEPEGISRAFKPMIISSGE